MADFPDLSKKLSDPERVKALYGAHLLDTSPEKFFDDITSNVCSYLSVPMSLITVLDVKRQFFKSCVGLPDEIAEKRQTPIDDSICQYVIQKRRAVIINDVKNDPLFRFHVGLQNVHAGSYLGIPVFKDNQIIASVCAVDIKSRTWSEEEISFMENKADCLKVEIAKR